MDLYYGKKVCACPVYKRAELNQFFPTFLVDMEGLALTKTPFSILTVLMRTYQIEVSLENKNTEAFVCMCYGILTEAIGSL